MQTAFDNLESEVKRKRAASSTASRGDLTGPVEGASDSAISDPSFSPTAERQTIDESQRSSEAVGDQAAASSSSAADAQETMHGNHLICTHLVGGDS